MKDWHARHEDIARAMDDLAPRVLPAHWSLVADFTNAKRYARKQHLATVVVIVEVECVDGELWAHMSASAHDHERRWRERGAMVTVGPKTRLCTWDELRACKDLFLGDRKAVQVLPPRAEYVNFNPYVLHLYSCLERDPLPDFRGTDSTGLTAI